MSQIVALTEQEKSQKNLAWITYILYALGWISGGLTSIVAIIINYVKMSDVRGTWLESHFRWQIRTFWIGFILAIVGIVLTFVLIGIPLLIALGIWSIYRIVKGMLYLNDNKPIA